MFPSRKSPCTMVARCCGGMRSTSRSCNSSTAVISVLVDWSHSTPSAWATSPSGRTTWPASSAEAIPVGPVDGGDLGARRLVPLDLPSAKLAGHVVFPLGDVAQAHGVDVDLVKEGHVVHQTLPRRGTNRGFDHRGRGGVVKDETLDVGHDVEGDTHRPVLGRRGQGNRVRHRHRGGPHGADEAPLPTHVVGGGEHPVKGGPAHDQAPAVGGGQRVGEVGPAPGDQLGPDRAGQRHSPIGQPPRHRLCREPTFSLVCWHRTFIARGQGPCAASSQTQHAIPREWVALSVAERSIGNLG